MIFESKKTFFTSDLHFGHENIIKYSERPFTSVEHMNESLVTNWNSVVSEKDHIFVLGDVCMGKLESSMRHLYRLNGTKYLIKGNHDTKSVKMPEFCGVFDWIKDYAEIKILDEMTGKKDQLVLFHFPIETWHRKHYGSFHLHGHTHGKLKAGSGRVDVGVDAFNYFPVRFDTLKKQLLEDG